MIKHLNLSVSEIDRPTSDSIVIYFNDHTGTIKHFFPGQFLTIDAPIEGKKARRSYSICTTPSELPKIGVCVKRVEGGLVSNFFLKQLKVGDTLEVLEPYGNFSCNTQAPNLPTLVLFAAGSGITPIFSILKSALENPCGNKIVLFYSNRSESSIIFKNQLDELVSKYPNRLKVIHLLSKNDSDFKAVPGRISRTLTADLVRYENLNNVSSVNYYVCGPDGMMTEVIKGLQDLGIPNDRIHKESFVSATSNAAAPTPPPNNMVGDDDFHEITVRFEGRDHKVKIEAGQYILEACLDAGLDLPYACQSGICGMCRAVKLEGEMSIDEQEAISDAEIDSGACLTCVGKPLSNNLLIDYDR